MSNSTFSQAQAWASVIDRSVKLAVGNKDFHSTPFFESVSQAMKAKLDHTEHKSLVDSPEILRDLVTPFFAETDYAVDKKSEVENDDTSPRAKKTKIIWEPNGTKTANSIMKALRKLIGHFPNDDRLQTLSDKIESLAVDLPDALKEDLGLIAPEIIAPQSEIAQAVAPEPTA